MSWQSRLSAALGKKNTLDAERDKLLSSLGLSSSPLSSAELWQKLLDKQSIGPTAGSLAHRRANYARSLGCPPDACWQDITTNHVPAAHVVIFGASISNRLFDSAQDRQICYDGVLAATGRSITIYELADEGYTSTDFLAVTDTKIASLSALPRDKSVKVLIHVGGNDVTDNRPYTAAQDSTVIPTMLANLNSIIDKIEAQGWDWMLNRLSFRDYNNACWDDESLGSAPYNARVIDVINAARGAGHYLYADGCPWGDYYTWVYNNNVAWLQYDNVHPVDPAGLNEWRQVIIQNILIPWVTGIAPSRIEKMAYTSRPTASIALSPTSAEEAGTLTYTITLSKSVPWNTRLTLGYSGTAVSGTDYVAGPPELVIPAGATTGQVVIQGLDDGLEDGAKTVIVTINTTGDGYTRLAPYTVTGTFTDAGTGGGGTPATGMAVGEIVRMSFGSATKTADANVNLANYESKDLTDGHVVFSNLVNTAGTAVDAALTLTTKPTGSANFGANNVGLNDGRAYSPYITALDCAQSWFVRATAGIMTLSGLPAGTYKVVVGGIRNDTTTAASTARTGAISFVNGGTSGTWDGGSTRTASNSNWHYEASDVVVGVDGLLPITFTTSTQNTTDYGYLGAIAVERLA